MRRPFLISFISTIIDVLSCCSGHPGLEHFKLGLLRVPAERLLGHTHAQGTEPQVIQASHRTHLQVGSSYGAYPCTRNRATSHTGLSPYSPTGRFHIRASRYSQIENRHITAVAFEPSKTGILRILIFRILKFRNINFLCFLLNNNII